ncbi:MAG: pectate lyase [Bryobacteraceae bacterium]
MRKSYLAAGVILAAVVAPAQAPPTRAEVLAGMRKAAEFYVNKVSTGGGYHFYYAEDLSYGRSEQGEGPTQVETQREGTPRVAMAFLEAYDATGDRFYLDAARKAAVALVEGQLCNGGWSYIIEFDPAKRKALPYRTEHACGSGVQKPPSTLDDNVTQASIRVLMRVDRALGFQDAVIHEAAQFALESMLKAQYPIGAWPQRYAAFPDPARFPVKRASYPEDWPRKWPGEVYYEHYTFNDNSIADDIDMMLEAAEIYKNPRFRASAERGGEFILMAQMPEPQPGWAQQYDRDMHPAWARVFEPPSITGGEAHSVMKTLLLLYAETGDRKYLEPIPRALAYYERSFLPPAQNRTEARRRFAPGEPVLARFFELKTNRPLYITKGTMIRAKGLGSIRPDGYQLSYSDESVITHYGVLTSGAWVAPLRAEYEKAAAAPRRRGAKLHGLSPWATGNRAPLDAQVGAAQVRRLLDSMDERGAWTEPGTIGKADLLVSLFAAHGGVLVVNGRPTPVKENDRIEIYDGTLPPRTRIIRSTTFAANLETLAAWAAKPKNVESPAAVK